MVTACPQLRRCGATFPAWLSGDHPSVADGTVERKVCVRNFDGCCKVEVRIKVKNCGSYYIYDLKNPGSCDFRYCSTD